MDFCCDLRKDVERRTIYRTKNFSVMPTLGPIGIEGYLLIVSNHHFVGFGNMPSDLDKELEEVIKRVRKVLVEQYSSQAIVFEHGPRLKCFKGGSCVDHAHIHVVPTKIDILSFLLNRFKLEKESSFDRLREICKNEKSSYLLFEDQLENRFVLETFIPLESQYIRKLIASKMDRQDWNWREYPGMEIINKTLLKLKDVFDQPRNLNFPGLGS